MNFVHLNVHSKASMLYGSANIDALVARAKELGQPAIALTDYSNVFNAIHFYRAATKAGIKPILGVTVLFVPDAEEYRVQKDRRVNHLILLAENEEGWKNIARITSAAQDKDHYFYNPRVDFKLLEAHSEGVIVIDGSSRDGLISSLLFDKKDEVGKVFAEAAPFKAQALVRRLLKTFDTDHLYLQVQNTNDPEQDVINEKLRVMAQKYGLQTVATNNVHYVLPSDAEAHRTLLEMNQNRYSRTTYADFTHEEFYLKSRKELSEAGFSDEELDATLAIAERCNVEIDITKRRLPKYAFVPDGMTAMEHLTQLANEGLQRIGKGGDSVYQTRIDRELGDIDEMGFADYFLIVHDVTSWIRSQEIMLGAGRGSVGGSLVAWALGITDPLLDPIEYGLIWERFLNKGRGGLPDIDTDVPQSRRQDVLRYVRERFGERNTAQLVTLGGLQAKSVLKEVFRVYDMPIDEQNKITALIPAKGDDHNQIDLNEAIEKVPELQEYEEKYKPWFTVARALEGCYKSTGIHAGAVVISDVPFDESPYPLVRAKDGDLLFGWDMGTVDSLSLLKLDILGLTTLDDVQRTHDLVKQRRREELSRQTMPLDDGATYGMLAQGFVVGVFQIEKQLGRTWAKNLLPRNIEEVSDLVSLIRPGPMGSDMHTSYREVKNGTRPASYIHDALEPILKSTYSGCLYQEQVIEICKQLAGMSLIDADKVRKAMGKKKPAEMAKWQAVFTDGCATNSIDADTAEEIWGYIEKFAGYGFNKSHGVGYALLTYETAWLKANYTVEFLCAKLQNSAGDSEKLSRFVHDARLFGLDVTPPRVRSLTASSHAARVRELADFTIPHDKAIAFGLTALKGVGKTAISDLLKLTADATTFDEFLWEWATIKHKVNTGVVGTLIKSGAMDEYSMERVQMMSRFRLLDGLTAKEREVVQALLPHQEGEVDWIRIVRALSDETKAPLVKEKYNVKIPNVRRRDTIRKLLQQFDGGDVFDGKAQKIAWEKHFLSVPLSGSEADIFRSRDTCRDIVKHGEPDKNYEIAVCLDLVKEHICKSGDPMAFVTGRDNSYLLDNIVVFPRQYARFRHLLEEGNVVMIRGTLNERGSLLTDRVERLA